MSVLRRKYVTWAGAAFIVLAASLAVAGGAQASSAGCAFSNGCATLHGTDANGNAVAMDAKYQRKTEILIGYPDQVGDNATSFDGVLHYGHGRATKVWNDTGVTDWSGFISTTSGTPAITTSGFGSYNGVTGCLDFKVSGGTPAGPAAGSSPTNLLAQPPAYKVTLAGLAGAVVTVAPAYSTAGVLLPGPYAASICVNGDNLVPGVYHNLTLTVSDAAATVNSNSITFAAEIHGVQVVNPGANTAFYTFVYAANGVWSNQCVTDINGSGALRLETCTLGHNTGQDFTIDSANGLLDGNQHHVSNLLSAAVNSAKSCLTDPSTSNAATPQSDAADEVAPGGRQLYVNGSCAVNTNLWSWGT